MRGLFVKQQLGTIAESMQPGGTDVAQKDRRRRKCRTPTTEVDVPLDRQDALKHLKTIEGHVRGVARMVEENAYCIDVLHQTLAIQRAIDKLNQNLLEHHLQTCVSRALQGQDSDDRARVIRELLDIFAVSTRR